MKDHDETSRRPPESQRGPEAAGKGATEERAEQGPTEATPPAPPPEYVPDFVSESGDIREPAVGLGWRRASPDKETVRRRERAHWLRERNRSRRIGRR